MVNVCYCCERVILCSEHGLCIECIKNLIREQTGEICQEILNAKIPKLFLCPLCQATIILNNTRLGG